MELSSVGTDKYASPYFQLNGLFIDLLWHGSLDEQIHSDLNSPVVVVDEFVMNKASILPCNRPHQTHSMYSGLASSSFVGAAKAIPSLSQLYHSVAHLYNEVHRHQNVQITWRTHFPQSALIIHG